MEYFLRQVNPNDLNPLEIRLGRKEITIGRSTVRGHMAAEKGLRLSRTHARLSKVNDKCFIKDLQSINGTFVNEIKLTKEEELQVGDRIGFGSKDPDKGFVCVLCSRKIEVIDIGDDSPSIETEQSSNGQDCEVFDPNHVTNSMFQESESNEQQLSLTIESAYSLNNQIFIEDFHNNSSGQDSKICDRQLVSSHLIPSNISTNPVISSIFQESTKSKEQQMMLPIESSYSLNNQIIIKSINNDNLNISPHNQYEVLEPEQRQSSQFSSKLQVDEINKERETLPNCNFLSHNLITPRTSNACTIFSRLKEVKINSRESIVCKNKDDSEELRFKRQRISSGSESEELRFNTQRICPGPESEEIRFNAQKISPGSEFEDLPFNPGSESEELPINVRRISQGSESEEKRFDARRISSESESEEKRFNARKIISGSESEENRFNARRINSESESEGKRFDAQRISSESESKEIRFNARKIISESEESQFNARKISRGSDSEEKRFDARRISSESEPEEIRFNAKRRRVRSESNSSVSSHEDLIIPTKYKNTAGKIEGSTNPVTVAEKTVPSITNNSPPYLKDREIAKKTRSDGYKTIKNSRSPVLSTVEIPTDNKCVKPNKCKDTDNVKKKAHPISQYSRKLSESESLASDHQIHPNRKVPKSSTLSPKKSLSIQPTSTSNFQNKSYEATKTTSRFDILATESQIQPNRKGCKSSTSSPKKLYSSTNLPKKSYETNKTVEKHLHNISSKKIEKHDITPPKSRNRSKKSNRSISPNTAIKIIPPDLKNYKIPKKATSDGNKTPKRIGHSVLSAVEIPTAKHLLNAKGTCNFLTRRDETTSKVLLNKTIDSKKKHNDSGHKIETYYRAEKGNKRAQCEKNL